MMADGICPAEIVCWGTATQWGSALDGAAWGGRSATLETVAAALLPPGFEPVDEGVGVLPAEARPGDPLRLSVDERSALMDFGSRDVTSSLGVCCRMELISAVFGRECCKMH